MTSREGKLEGLHKKCIKGDYTRHSRSQYHPACQSWGMFLYIWTLEIPYIKTSYIS